MITVGSAFKSLVEPSEDDPATIDVKTANPCSAFLNWARARPDFFDTPTASTIDFFGKKIYRAEVRHKQYSDRVGIGRDTDSKLAFIKAYSEVLERSFATQIYQQSTVMNVARWIVSNGQLTIESSDSVERSLPPPGLLSSNGWATHFSPEAAARNAIVEALERSILISTYCRSGWQGFHKSRAVQYDGLTFESVISNVEVGGFSSGMVIGKSQKHPGSTFGFLCEKNLRVRESQRWIHAFLEAYEPLAVFERFSSQDIKAKTDQRNWFAKTQLSFLIDKCAPEIPELSFDTLKIPSASGFIRVFDLSKHWQLPFPYFAAFAFGGSLVPLYMNDHLEDLEREYLSAALNQVPGVLGIPHEHPII